MKREIKSLILCVWACSLLGCAVSTGPVYEKRGMSYGIVDGTFRSKWYDYYERGRSYMEGEYWEDATGDFKRAISQRDKDQRRARTYGMHFLDYFPHRELGVAYFKQGKLEESIQELEESLRVVDSARAKYFLNKARKSLLEKSRQDLLPPSIAIKFPPEHYLTNRFSISIEGSAEDDSFVSALIINNNPIQMELAEKRISFREEVPLHRGLNEIAVTAADLMGKTSRKIIRIDVDQEGPMLSFDLPEIPSPLPLSQWERDRVREGKKILIGGSIYDESGIRRLTLNGEEVKLPLIRSGEGSFLRFQQQIQIPYASNMVIFMAEDRVGNVTRGKLDISSVTVHQEILKEVQNDILNDCLLSVAEGMDLSMFPRLASMDIVNFSFPFHPLPNPPPSRGRAGMGGYFRGNLARMDEIPPPEIHLRDMVDTQTTYMDQIYIEGNITARAGIKEVLINGKPLSDRKEEGGLSSFLASLLEERKNNLFFNFLTKLEEGENRIIIEAVDSYGKRGEKVVTIIRKIRKIHQIGSRMYISILPFKQEGDAPESLSSLVYNNLISSFHKQKRFNLVEREQLDEIAREQKLSLEKIFDQTTAIKLGKLCAAEAILMGTIFGTKNSLEIYARLVNTETSLIMEEKDVFHEDRSLGMIKLLGEGLALKFKQSFPLCQGLIIKKEGKEVLVNLGLNSSIKRDMKYIVYREEEPIEDPITERVLGVDTEILGEARVKEIQQEFSRADILDAREDQRIGVLNKVITK